MKEPKITPRAKYILVQPDEKKSRMSESGLLKPSNLDEEQKAIGTVVAVGESIEDVKVGKRVIYGAFAGEKISLNGSTKDVDFVLLHDDDILAFIED